MPRLRRRGDSARITHIENTGAGAAPTQMTAAAQILHSRKIQRSGTTKQKKSASFPWQNDAWLMYDEIGELWFAINWAANNLSRVKLYAARVTDEDGDPAALSEGPAAELVADWAGGPGGQAAFLSRIGAHLALVGDSYIVGKTCYPDADEPGAAVKPADPTIRIGPVETPPDAPDVEWQAYSTDEISYDGGWRVNDGFDQFDISDADLIIRCWRPHPRRWSEAQSAVRSSLPILRELRGLTMHVSAQVDSRLAGAGILFVPQSITFAGPSAGQEGDAADGEDPFIRDLIEHMLTPIKDRDSAAAVVPLVVKVPDESIGKIEHISFAGALDEKAKDLRDEALRRFALGQDLPASIILGQEDSNHWCTLPHVRIMTESGWKTYDELRPGDLVLTLNHVTGLSEWQPVQRINVFDVTDEPMISLRGRRHTSTTTRSHRWPTIAGRWDKRERTWTTSGELLGQAQGVPETQDIYQRVIMAAPAADIPTEIKYSDALVELVAWYYTEGNGSVRPGRQRQQYVINQSHKVNPENCERIARALTVMFGPESAFEKGGRYSTPESVARREQARRLRADDPTISLNEIGRRLGVSGVMAGKYLTQDARLADDVPRWRTTTTSDGQMTRFLLNSAAGQIVLEHAPNRVVSLDFIRALTVSQLELFLDVSVRADGHLAGGTTRVLHQKEPERLDAFELAALLSGRSVRRYTETGIGRSAAGPVEKTMHVIAVSDKTSQSLKAGHVSETRHTGIVWCPTTENGTWLARDGDHAFFTGNSAWLTDEQSVRAHVAPMASAVCLALTIGWLQPALEELGLPDASDHMVWFDLSALIHQPDRSAIALDLHDRILISDEAVRRETGFNESDKPLPQEFTKRILLKLLSSGGDATPILRQLGIAIGSVDDGQGAPAGDVTPEPSITPSSDPRTIPELTEAP